MIDQVVVELAPAARPASALAAAACSRRGASPRARAPRERRRRLRRRRRAPAPRPARARRQAAPAAAGAPRRPASRPPRRSAPRPSAPPRSRRPGGGSRAPRRRPGLGISASTLSVEISNSGWSRSTFSPTLTSHLVIVPSAIDSPICGITTSVAIASLRRLVCAGPTVRGAGRLPAISAAGDGPRPQSAARLSSTQPRQRRLAGRARRRRASPPSAARGSQRFLLSSVVSG